jgi:urease accessory protein
MNKRLHGPLLTGALLLLPLPVLAHTGAGHLDGFGAGLIHPLGGLDHLLAMVAVGLWAAQMGGKALWRVPGAFVSVMLLGAVLAVAGISVPYVEQGIAVSVLVLGVLIAAAFRLAPLVSALLVGVFALFHGHAHGAEMPLASTAALYSLGFASGTALLHAIGAGGGLWLQRWSSARAVRLTGGAITLVGMYLAVA